MEALVLETVRSDPIRVQSCLPTVPLAYGLWSSKYGVRRSQSNNHLKMEFSSWSLLTHTKWERIMNVCVLPPWPRSLTHLKDMYFASNHTHTHTHIKILLDVWGIYATVAFLFFIF